VARVWNYLTGGRDNFDADRKAARQLIRASPAMERAGYATRQFVGRVTRYLAGEAGIRQFLDIGTGIPTPGSVHDVAQSVQRESRVVCVDNDPVVLSHARALLRHRRAPPATWTPMCGSRARSSRSRGRPWTSASRSRS
jgi:predicted O-methyltransferase YrrM